MEKENKKDGLLPSIALLISVSLIVGAWVYTSRLNSQINDNKTRGALAAQANSLEERVLPSRGVVLPVSWGNLGARLVNAGVIDSIEFKNVYSQRGPFTDEYANLLLGQDDGPLKITPENAEYLLNLFWALGLANTNPILEKEMMDPKYGGAGNFASTAGWTVSRGNIMNHYGRHNLIDLTSEQQNLVEKLAKGIFRPCCGNSTYFPDCNHGMAMLGFLQLMASQNVSEEDMWRAALAVNSYWFPDVYLNIADQLEYMGFNWTNASPEEILGPKYSSFSGYKLITNQISARQQPKNGATSGGGGCSL